MAWLDGSVALVTGGGSGIGRGVVETFIAEGARVGVLERSVEKVGRLRQVHGGSVVVMEGDATYLEDNQHAVAETVRTFGRLDTLVCCVGIFDQYAALVDVPDTRLSAAFTEIFNVNVKSYVLSAKAAVAELRRARGSMIFTLSSAGFYADGAGFLYGATKWAARGLVVHLAHELAPEVRVNGVAPGGTGGTQLAGLTSLGQHVSADQAPGRDERVRASLPLQVLPLPEDHAWAYVYLASRDKARVLTGTVINTDGGRGVAGVSRLAGLLPAAP